MHYYLDGYNLMFRILRAGGNLCDKRNQIVRDIHQKSAVLNLNITLVFDSQYQTNEFGKSHFRNLEIIFSDFGETADERILRELRNVANPQLYTVVSSDKKLAWLARRRYLKTESVEVFIQWLNQRYRNRLKSIKKGPLPSTVSKLEKVQKIATIQESTHVNDCYDYYLDYFQQEYEHLEQAEGLKKDQRKAHKKSKKNPKKTEQKEAILDVWEYWLKTFENKPEEGLDF